MNRRPIVTGAVFLCMMIVLGGCEELEELDKPDYINVFVTCDVNVVLFPLMGSMDDPQTLPAKYLEINVEIVKAGGERVEQVVYSDITGKTGAVSASFKLYREQPITCIANVVGTSAETEYPEYTFNSDSKTIDWNDIYPANDFGDQVSRSITLNVYGMHKDA